MTKQEYMDFHKSACDKMIDVTKKKNSDYTGGSDDPFANFEQVGHFVQLPQIVVIGFFTRMSDKFSRIGSFITKGSLLVADESVEDTLIDLANYCILLAGYLRSQKGESK
jgi:Nucleotide modification associated domain 1